MEPVPCGVSVRQDERLTGPIPHVLEIRRVIEDLVKDGDESFGILGIVAITGRDGRGERNVRLVVCTVDIHAIPAGRKDDL